jgi:hypothetical protein
MSWIPALTATGLLSVAGGVAPKCEERFTTYEYIEEVPLMVVKRDGRRQAV